MHADQIENFNHKAPDLLADLAKHIEVELNEKSRSTSNAISPEMAKNISIEIAYKIAHAWGGQVVYIPRNLLLLLSERDMAIYQEFNGCNHRELAKKYNVSMQWIYQIVKKVGKEEIRRRQIDMFA